MGDSPDTDISAESAASAIAAAIDETERRCIKTVCPMCWAADWPVRDAPLWWHTDHDGESDPRPIHATRCPAGRIWEERFQRGRP